MASAAFVGLHAGVAQAADDEFMKMAKDYIAQASAPVTTWDGPTTGPKAQGKKLVIYVSADQKNGGASGVGDGAQEAAKAMGWDFRILDGQGSVPARSSALTQAIALKPDGIILGTVDAAEQAPIVEQAVAAGIKVVGWHAGPGPGKIEAVPGVFTNITTDPNEVAKASGLYAVVDSGGTAGVILFTDSIYAIATAKTNAEKAAVEGCKGCKVLSIEDTPIGDLSNRMGQLTTSLLAKYGKAWTYSIAVNDLYYDFSAPSLQAAGIDPAAGYPRQIAAGDGSVPAFQRIRREAVSAGHRRRTAAFAWLAVHRRNEPRLGRPAAERLRGARPSVHQRQHRQGRRRAEHLRSRERLQGSIQEDLGRDVSR